MATMTEAITNQPLEVVRSITPSFRASPPRSEQPAPYQHRYVDQRSLDPFDLFREPRTLRS